MLADVTLTLCSVLPDEIPSTGDFNKHNSSQGSGGLDRALQRVRRSVKSAGVSPASRGRGFTQAHSAWITVLPRTELTVCICAYYAHFIDTC